VQRSEKILSGGPIHREKRLVQSNRENQSEFVSRGRTISPLEKRVDTNAQGGKGGLITMRRGNNYRSHKLKSRTCAREEPERGETKSGILRDRGEDENSTEYYYLAGESVTPRGLGDFNCFEKRTDWWKPGRLNGKEGSGGLFASFCAVK